jgi:hypothetical protein
VLHTVTAAQQSGFARGAAVVVILVVAALYLWVREQRGKKRRS